MAAKVTPEVLARILELKTKYQLTDKVISIRLGISERTIRVYTRSNKTQTKPYRPEEPIVQP